VSLCLRRWVGSARSLRGRLHVRDGLPCQDASRAFAGGTALALVADGAGSAPLAAEGAALVAETVSGLCAEAALWGHPDPGRRILEACRECLQAAAARLDRPLSHLASTLVLVAVRGGRYLALNLGDGVVACLDTGGPRVLLRPRRGEYANQTHFLTGPDPWGHLQVAQGPLDGIRAFAVMSDGAAEGLYRRRDGTLAPALGRLWAWARQGQTPDRVEQALDETLLPLLAARSGDDLSVALLYGLECPAAALEARPLSFRRTVLGVRRSDGLAHRQAVLARRLAGRAPAEAAADLGLSPATVRRHWRALDPLLVARETPPDAPDRPTRTSQ